MLSCRNAECLGVSLPRGRDGETLAGAGASAIEQSLCDCLFLRRSTFRSMHVKHERSLSDRHTVAQRMEHPHQLGIGDLGARPNCRAVALFASGGGWPVSTSTSHPIPHRNSDGVVGRDGMKGLRHGQQATDFLHKTGQESTGRDGQQRITKPLHCHCANPARSVFSKCYGPRAASIRSISHPIPTGRLSPRHLFNFYRSHASTRSAASACMLGI